MDEQEHDSVLHFMLTIRLYNTDSNFANALHSNFFFFQRKCNKIAFNRPCFGGNPFSEYTLREYNYRN